MNNEELKTIYMKYSKDIFNIAYHITGNKQESEDIVQLTFIKLGDQKLDLNRNEKYWLIRVATNLCLDNFRRFKRFCKFTEEINNINGNDMNSIEKQVELTDSIKNIFKVLSIKERTILILKYMEELSYEDISQILNIKTGSLKSISSRAIAKIKHMDLSHE